MAAVNDKPTVQFSLAALRKEVAKPETFRVSLSGSKIVTFPDLFALEVDEAEAIFSELSTSASWPGLAKWLSPADLTALKAEKLTYAELATVAATAIKHYRAAYGQPGESSASAS